MKKFFTTLLLAALGCTAFAQETAEVLTPQGIIVTPAEGVKTTYLRSGGTYELNGASVAMGTQSGTIDIVECDDNTVYLHNPISCYLTGAWVKGTRSGNTITVPANQPLTYSEEYNITLNMNWGTVSPDGVMAYDATHSPEFVYTVAGNTLSLVGTSRFDGQTNAPFAGLFWDDADHTATYYGDYETVYTFDPDYKPASTEPIALPDELYAETWKARALTMTSATPEGEEYNTDVMVGIVENEVYVRGLFTGFPDAWIRGIIAEEADADGKHEVVFPKLQWLGTRGAYNVWMVGRTEEGMCDGIMTYDPAAQTFTATNAFLANAAEDRIYYVTWLEDVVISSSVDAGDELVATGAPVDVPYCVDFEDPAQNATLGLINANSDGFTWEFFVEGTGNNCARYFSSYTNAADEYLVTPAVRLESGRAYRISLDVCCNTFYGFCKERFEVLAGREARRSALTMSVIEPTVVDHEDYINYSNGSFTVAESGLYHFAIHAISDVDQNLLFVDNFKVESETPNAIAHASTDKAKALQFNLAGQRTAQLQPGSIIVQDGRKMISK